MRPDGQEEEPLIAGVKSLYAQLFSALQAKAAPGERLILTGHCYMVNGCVSELSERKILAATNMRCLSNYSRKTSLTSPWVILHLAQQVGANHHIRYSGLADSLCSFDESHYPHQVVQVDIKAGQPAATVAIKIPRSVELLRIPNSKDFAVLPDVLSSLRRWISMTICR